MRISSTVGQKKFVMIAPLAIVDKKIDRSEPAQLFGKNSLGAEIRWQIPTILYTADDLEELRKDVHKAVDDLIQSAKDVWEIK